MNDQYQNITIVVARLDNAVPAKQQHTQGDKPGTLQALAR